MKCMLCSVEPQDPREIKRGLHLNCAFTFIQDRKEAAVAIDKELMRVNKAATRSIKDLEEQLALSEADRRALAAQPVNQFLAPDRVRRAEQLAARAPPPTDQKCPHCTHQQSSHLSGICAVCNKDCTKPPEPPKAEDRFSLIELE
jgi:hypothetical protein